jgi:hypothetical protein
LTGDFLFADIIRRILLALAILSMLLPFIAELRAINCFWKLRDNGPGYPRFKISFRTDSYPMTFLLTEEGRILDINIANKLGDVAYLHLTRGKPLADVVRHV